MADRYEKDSFGIVRMGRTWTVRLGFKEGKPIYKKKFYDDDYGTAGALSAALDDRDNKRKILQEFGMCLCTRKKSTIDENGRIRKLYLNKCKKSYAWKIFITLPCGKVYARTFSFYKTGKVRQAFICAVLYYRKKEIELYGISTIERSMKAINGYLNAYIKSLDKNSERFRELRRFL